MPRGPCGHSGGAGIIVQNGAREAISGGNLSKAVSIARLICGRDTIGRERAVDDAEGGALAIEVDQRLGRPRVDPQPIERDGSWSSARAWKAPPQWHDAASPSIGLRSPATLADEAPAQAPDQLLLRHGDFDDDDGPPGFHQDVEREALVNRPGKAVQDESALRVGQDDALGQDLDHHLVVDELPAVHEELHRAPERRRGERGPPEHVAGAR